MKRFSATKISLAAALFVLTVGSVYGAAGPAALGNDESCDISVTPAATLLLPYFEVAIDDPAAGTTLFTVTNVTGKAQVARVTLWTDLSYPVVTFNIYLTGYDVQSLNLYDVIALGRIGASAGTGTSLSAEGEHSGPNHLLDASACDVIPPLDPATLTRMRQAFTTGSIGGFCNKVGLPHENAVGYATIDVVGNCGMSGPTDLLYFVEDIRFDNVLIGDYMQIIPDQSSAHANPMVHIRAIPAGGTPRSREVLHFQTRFAQTFYGRFQDPAHRGADARQPLPSIFAARWVDPSRSEQQETFVRIWREGRTSASANCADYQWNLKAVTETIAFDEDENGEGFASQGCGFPSCVGQDIGLPSTAMIQVEDRSEVFPQGLIATSDAGWLFVNLDDDGFFTAGTQNDQSWVVVSIREDGKYSVDFDAAWLGNGCSPTMPRTGFSGNGPAISYPGPQHPNAILPGPAPDLNPPWR